VSAIPIGGHVEPGFERVREAFTRAFRELGETGGACAVYHRGRLVADLWGGFATPGAPWTRDTLVGVYSTGKPLAALGLLALVGRGIVGLDDPVTRGWPEYAAAGKGATTVRQVLTHRAGLMTLDPPLSHEALLDWGRVTSALAGAAPNWAPGEEQGEHAVFYGHLVGEIARRASGVAFGEWLRREVAAPWGLDVHVGLDPAGQERCATLRGAAPLAQAAAAEPDSLRRRAMFSSSGMLREEIVNGRAWREACIPALNAHATARAIAALHAALLAGGDWNGARVLPEPLAREMTREQFRGFDHFLQDETRWGLGVQLDTDGFGHGGLGGSLGWADPACGVAFGYVTAELGTHDRASAAWEAARAAAGAA
jgi:CubicO group peptidase (beta-lactamase class C family)